MSQQQARDRYTLQGCALFALGCVPGIVWMIHEGFTFPSVLLCILNFSLVGLVNKLIHRRLHPDWLGGQLDAYELLEPIRSGETVPPDVVDCWRDLPQEAQMRAYPQIIAACLDYIDSGDYEGEFHIYIVEVLSGLMLPFEPERLDAKLMQRFHIVRLLHALRIGENLLPIRTIHKEKEGGASYKINLLLRIPDVQLRLVASVELGEAISSDKFWREGLDEEAYLALKQKQELSNTKRDSTGILALFSDRLLFTAGKRVATFPLSAITELRCLGNEMLAVSSSVYSTPLYFSPVEADGLVRLLEALKSLPSTNK